MNIDEETLLKLNKKINVLTDDLEELKYVVSKKLGRGSNDIKGNFITRVPDKSIFYSDKGKITGHANLTFNPVGVSATRGALYINNTLTQSIEGDILYIKTPNSTTSSAGDIIITAGDGRSAGGHIRFLAGNRTVSGGGVPGSFYFICGHDATTISQWGKLDIDCDSAQVLGGAVTDAEYCSITMNRPYYSGSYNIARHNYIRMSSPQLTGGATMTDACVIRFPQAPGTHKAVDIGTTKISPWAVDAWMKININGTVYYMPSYVGKGENTTADLTIPDGKNIILNTTTGTKIGTAITQKLGFFNVTPIVQPINTTDLKDALIALGFIATGGATPLDLDGGGITAIGNNSLGQITITDAKNIILGTTTGTKIGTATDQKLAFYNSAPVVQPIALTTQLTTITYTAPGTPDYALQDLVQNTGFGFVTKDEGNTTLSVIANLQTRVSELEAKLQSLGLLA